MKIILDEIPEDGALDVEFSEGEDVLNGLFKEGLERDYHFSSPVKGSFHISRSGKTIFVDMELDGDVTVRCSSCLEKFEHPVTASSSLKLYPEEPEHGKEVGLEAEAAERSFYSQERVDLEEILREETSLALPFNPRCNEECKGLCPSCGQNLNKGRCECKTQNFDKRFDILKDLKI